MSQGTELTATIEDHEKAFTEVCFLLEVLSETINQVIGQSTSSLGITAGRQMAKRMPVYLKNPDLSAVLEAIRKRLESGFEMSAKPDAKGAQIQMGRCAIREVCKNRGQKVGGQLCTLFHYYLAGMTAEFLGKPVRAGQAQAGETCSFGLECAR